MLSYTGHSVDKKESDAICKTVLEEWLSQGKDIGLFEERVKSFLNSGHEKQVVATSSGTASLHAALVAMGIERGDEVIVPSLSWVATANAVELAGATPIFADIDPKTLGLSEETVRRKVGPKTKCVIPVHFAGVPVDLLGLRKLCDEKNLILFDDAAHAFGSRLKVNGKWEYIGGTSLCDVSAFSFHPAKNITTGEGGIMTFSSPTLTARARQVINHGVERDPSKWDAIDYRDWGYDMPVVGFNYRMTTISASLGLVQMDKYTQFKKRRDEIVAQYYSLLENVSDINLPILFEDKDPCWNLFPIRIKGGASVRGELKNHLQNKGIGSMIQYPLIHKLSYYRKRYKVETLPESEKYEGEGLCIPLHVNLSNEDVLTIAHTIIDFFKR